MFQLTLKNLREKNGLSQADLARTLGVSRSTIGMWEYLVVRRQQSAASGDFVLLRLNETELVRQITFDAHGVILQALNHSHFPSYHKLTAGGDIPFLIGKVIQLQRNFD